MRSVGTSLLVFMLCAVTTPSPAQSLTGNDLKRYCESMQSFCLGYVLGASKMFLEFEAYIAARGDPNAPTVCLSDGVSYGQLLDVFTSYMETHPDRRHVLAHVLVAEAMNDAFPCKTP